MPQMDRTVLTVAQLIREQLIGMQPHEADAFDTRLQQLDASYEHLHSLRRKLYKCRQRGLFNAAKRLRLGARYVLADHRLTIEAIERALQPPKQEVPTLHDLVNEMDQLEEEFGQWEYNDNDHGLSVTTEPIELDGSSTPFLPAGA